VRGRPRRQVGGSDQEAAITGSLSGLLPAAGLIDVPAAHLTTTAGVANRAALPVPAGVDLPNPLDGVGSFVGGQLVDAVKDLLRALTQDFLSQLAAPVARYVLSTPDLLAEPTLRAYWLTALAVLTACAGLLVTLAGLAIIPGDTRLGHSAREAVGTRLTACLLTAAISLPLVALEVNLANRLVHAFIGEGFATDHNPLWTTLSRTVTGDPGAQLALLVTATVGVVLLVGLVMVGLARWATLWLLIVLAPVVMGFAILPGGEGLVRLWWRLQLATVFLPVANAVLLGTYVAMFSSDQTGLVGALSGVAVLALMGKLPTWIAGAAVGVEGSELSHRVRRTTSTGRRVVTTIAAAATGGTSAAAMAATSGRSRASQRTSRAGSDAGTPTGISVAGHPRGCPGGRGTPHGIP